MPTHDEIIERYGHRMVGIVLDLCLSGAKGTELSWRLKVARQQIRDELSMLYYDLIPGQKPTPNGTANANNGRTPQTSPTPNPPGTGPCKQTGQTPIGSK